ncbi:MAG: tetratricopeptide repeat protein, partial [Woeseiaceae bacterium]|nr:tetratricopeptide repeat protein [Woeseiaceae bacterium]
LGVINGKVGDKLKHVARLRLARIYLYQDKAQEVVDMLSGEDVGAFAAAYGEVLGDAYTALGRVALAQDEYQKVLMDPLSQGTVDPQIVQWKALDLPEVQPEPPVESEPESDTAEPESAATVEVDETVTEENE